MGCSPSKSARPDRPSASWFAFAATIYDLFMTLILRPAARRCFCTCPWLKRSGSLRRLLSILDWIFQRSTFLLFRNTDRNLLRIGILPEIYRTSQEGLHPIQPERSEPRHCRHPIHQARCCCQSCQGAQWYARRQATDEGKHLTLLSNRRLNLT